MNRCDGQFYSLWGILRRAANSFLRRRRPVLSLVSNLSYRENARLSRKSYGDLDLVRGSLLRVGPRGGSLMNGSVPADDTRLESPFDVGTNRPVRSART